MVRFPIQFLISVFAVVIWWFAIYSTTETQTQNFVKLLALSNLAFCLTLSADLFSETKPLNTTKKWLIRALIIVFCIVLFYVLSPQWYVRDIYRFALLIIAGHLLVSFAPYSQTNKKHAFWQYNKLLFLRFLTAVLYSGTLFLGLLIALLSTKSLFNLNIDDNIYFSLFAFIAAGFNTLFFLAGIPANMSSFEQDSNYPKGLKVFTQYVLIPLLTVYLLILIVYELKILIDQKLPEGMVSILILGYAVFGILSYLLTYPIRNQKGNEWLKLFSKLFFILMIPLLVLLFIAVWVRIADYAITEPRYFLVLLSIWLSGITIYFLAKKSPTIQTVPISLCILALISTFGPQSASSIAKRSQIARYNKLDNKVNSEKEKAAIINYMVANYGLKSLQPLTDIDLTPVQNQIKEQKSSIDNLSNDHSKLQNTAHQVASSPTLSSYEIKNKLRDTAYSILKVKPLLYNPSSDFINIKLANKTIDISEYNTMVDFQSYSKTNKFLVDHEKANIEYLSQEEKIKIFLGENDSTTIDLNPFYDSLREKIINADNHSFKMNGDQVLIPDSILTLTAESKEYKLALLFKTLTIPQAELTIGENNSNSSFSGVLLIKEKE
jgi:hypothetical protein